MYAPESNRIKDRQVVYLGDEENAPGGLESEAEKKGKQYSVN